MKQRVYYSIYSGNTFNGSKYYLLIVFTTNCKTQILEGNQYQSGLPFRKTGYKKLTFNRPAIKSLETKSI